MTKSTLDDLYLVKFAPSGSRLWATYYGGTGSDNGGNSITDHHGHVYLIGSTESYQNLALNGWQNSTGSIGCFTDGLIVKFNSQGQRIWLVIMGVLP